jgi:hypothetical protein
MATVAHDRLRRPPHQGRAVKREIIRCQRRFLAREIYHLLPPMCLPAATVDPPLQAVYRRAEDLHYRLNPALSEAG